MWKMTAVCGPGVLNGKLNLASEIPIAGFLFRLCQRDNLDDLCTLKKMYCLSFTLRIRHFI